MRKFGSIKDRFAAEEPDEAKSDTVATKAKAVGGKKKKKGFKKKSKKTEKGKMAGMLSERFAMGGY